MKKMPALLVMVPLLLVAIVVILKWDYIKGMSYDSRTGQVNFTFYPGKNARGLIKPKEGLSKATGQLNIISADSAIPLPDLKPISGDNYVKIHRKDAFTQEMYFQELPQSGFSFAYNGPQPKKIKLVDPSTGNTVYVGVPSVIGADEATVAFPNSEPNE